MCLFTVATDLSRFGEVSVLLVFVVKFYVSFKLHDQRVVILFRVRNVIDITGLVSVLLSPSSVVFVYR